ncbi:MAG TPA: hypothetical protein VKY22_29385 [Bradyrhizobium sp.]|nr:hypothetical protein [Bradyrhizobium sp.]
MTEPVRYRDRMDIRVEPALREALQGLAVRHRVKVAELIRNALWTAVALQGDAPDARADGARRYARVMGDGALVDTVYVKPAP